jgi:hypothetical protein
MVRNAALFALVLSVFSISSLAQNVPFPQQQPRMGGSTFSAHELPTSLSGTVVSADNKPLKDVRVDLRDGNGSTLFSVYTNASGMFEFGQVHNGAYEVVATSGLEQTQQRVEMAAMPTTISLRLPVRSTAADGNPGNSVSVAEYRVPAKAREELKKGREASIKGNIAEAEKHDARALEIYPQYADALTLSAILKMDANDPAGAVADLQ